ncbi:MAG: hypothetical protein VR73_10475 [Gammaproteobacteria bacterium BRH_c0]|nr:MAG: hypothetical protein VR73_10475 [Gammaproteobacteria bacterium BRH_c0]
MPALNERFTARVRALSSEGNGIVEHRSGQVFFVPGVWPGESGEFRITGFKSRFGFAVLETLQQPSPQRIVPPCPHQGVGKGDCGGCPWQFVSYEAQLEAKQARVSLALARLSAEECIRPILGSDSIFGYRNRAQLKTDGRVLGFVSHGSRDLAAVDDCLVLSDKNRATLKAVAATLPNRDLAPGRKQDWTTIDIDEDVSADTLVLNQRRPFRQGNSGQNQRMQAWLAERLAGLDKSIPVLELFAGSGNFTQVIAAAGFGRILAAEGSAEAIEALQARQLPGVEALVCNLFNEDSFDTLRRRLPDAGIVVLDPPRDGLKQAARLLPKKHKVRDILYISCDLATFTRDVGVFMAKGFKLTEVQPLDLFPHTPHVELLAWLRC